MSNLKEYLESRTNNPFWWAFIVSFLILNWKLVVTSVFEFSTMSYSVFEYHLVVGYWLLIPFAAGFANAIFGQSFTEFLAALSQKIYNETKLWYIKFSNDTVVTKSKYDNLQSRLDQESKRVKDLVDDLTSETRLAQINQEDLDGYRAHVDQRFILFQKRIVEMQSMCNDAIHAGVNGKLMRDQVVKIQSCLNAFNDDLKNIK
jgi:hypothetical protein